MTVMSFSFSRRYRQAMVPVYYGTGIARSCVRSCTGRCQDFIVNLSTGRTTEKTVLDHLRHPAVGSFDQKDLEENLKKEHYEIDWKHSFFQCQSKWTIFLVMVQTKDILALFDRLNQRKLRSASIASRRTRPLTLTVASSSATKKEIGIWIPFRRRIPCKTPSSANESCTPIFPVHCCIYCICDTWIV